MRTVQQEAARGRPGRWPVSTPDPARGAPTCVPPTSLPSQLPPSACDHLDLTSRTLTANPDLTEPHRITRQPRPSAKSHPLSLAQPGRGSCHLQTVPLLAGMKGSIEPIFIWGSSGQEVGSPRGKGRRPACPQEKLPWRNLRLLEKPIWQVRAEQGAGCPLPLTCQGPNTSTSRGVRPSAPSLQALLRRRRRQAAGLAPRRGPDCVQPPVGKVTVPPSGHFGKVPSEQDTTFQGPASREQAAETQGGERRKRASTGLFLSRAGS